MDNFSFQEGEFYMHLGSKDVAIEVVEVLGETLDRIVMIVHYWNLGCTGKPWRIAPNQTAEIISTKRYQDWVHIDYDLLCEPRYKPGPPGT